MNLYDFEQRKQPRKSGISKAKETEFHAKLDALVHDTFGKRKGEMEESWIDDLAPDQLKALGGNGPWEQLQVGDPVIISGKGINFEGATGDVVELGKDGRFVVVDLYNHGKHSFHSSDVSYNDYADSDDEEARMYDAGEFRDEDLTEFAPAGDDGDRDPEEILFQLAKQWWLGTEQEMIRAERTLASMGWEIGEDEGYDDGGVFVVRAGDENGKSYISWAHDDLQGVDEARANTAGARAGLARRANAKPLSPEEQAAKDKAKSDKWLEKERAKMASKKGVAEGTEQQYAVTIDAIDHGVLAPVTVVANSPEEAKQKAIAGVKTSMIKRGYELMVRSVSAKPTVGVAEEQVDEVSRGDYHKKATMAKAMAQMSAGFARSPEEREKFTQIAGRRERGLERSKARTDKFWADKAAKDEADRLEQLRAKYAGVDIDAEIAKLQPAIDRAYHEYQYGARNTYSQGRDEYNSLMGRVQELERAKKALASNPPLSEISNDLLDRYKKELGVRATAADKAGNYDKGHEYFKKINKATLRQGENDARRHAQEKENEIVESRLKMMRKAGYDL